MSYELINYCEIDNFASQSYSRIHNVSQDLNLGDIMKVDTKDIKDFDLLVGGSPCFIAGTPVFTDKGFVNIEDIRVGDMVLTHKNRFMPVDRIGHNLDKEIYELKAMGSLPILATPNHPFLTVTRTKKYNKELKKSEYIFSEPYKKRLDELEVGKDFLCSPILQIEENPYHLDEETCWILGRYVADGHIKKDKRKDRKNSFHYQVVLSIGESKLEYLKTKIKKQNFSSFKHTKYVYRVCISSKELVNFIEEQNFGEGALNKKVPNVILNLPIHLLQSFLDGYFSGDGCYIKKSNVYQATTISYNLAMTLQLAIQKVYKVGCRLYFDKRPETYVIEGRTVNQHSTYMIRFTKEITKQKQYYVKNDMILYPIKSIEDKNYKDTVYNLEVRDDHTYNVQSNICSNCQDFSASGKKAGSIWTCKDCKNEYNPLTAHFTKRDKCPKCNSTNLEKTRSSLIVEYLRILRDKKPKFAIYENVKNLVGKEFKPTFDLFVKELEEYGYNVYQEILNAKFYGVPQNRERIILVAIRKDIDNGKFKYPEPFDSGIRLKDILATRIDENFYISKDKTEKLLNNLDDNIKEKLFQSMNNINNIGLLDFKAKNQCRGVHSINGISPTLTTMQGGQQEPKVLVEKNPNEILKIGNLEGSYDLTTRVYSEDGICPTLTTMQGGNLEPKVLTNQIIKVGDLEDSKFEQNNRVYSENGVAPTLMARTDSSTCPKVLINEVCENCILNKLKETNDINKIDLKDTVKVRKYEVNISALKELLNFKKKQVKLTNKEIAEKLNVKRTTVDHWFRKDDSFAIPDADIWFKLKELLEIKNDTFDKPITEFIEKENIFEKSNRVYCTDGIAPTLTTVSADEKVIYPCAMIACEPRTDGMVLFNDNVCGTLRTIQACGDKHIIEGIANPIDLPLCCSSRGRNPENPKSREPGLPTEQMLEVNKNGTSNTLTTVQKDNYILEPCALKYERTEYGKEIRKEYEAGNINEKISNMRELSPRKDGICNTLTTVQKDNYIFDPSWFAIRKLIPLECFRLMGFTDEDFNKAKYYTDEEVEGLKKSGKKYKTEIDEQGNERVVCLSNSQAYKQAGNSIVTNVLYEVYKELYLAMPELFGTEEEPLRLVSLFSGIGAFEKGLDMLDNWRKDINFTQEKD